MVIPIAKKEYCFNIKYSFIYYWNWKLLYTVNYLPQISDLQMREKGILSLLFIYQFIISIKQEKIELIICK